MFGGDFFGQIALVFCDISQKAGAISPKSQLQTLLSNVFSESTFTGVKNYIRDCTLVFGRN